MREKIKLPSGAELDAQVPDFAQAKRLLKVVAAQLTKADIGNLNLGRALRQNQDGTVALDLLQADFKIDGLKNAFLQLIASDEVEAVLHACMEPCLYRGQKITFASTPDLPATFEEPQNRADYFPCAWEVARITLSPFWSSLASKFSKKPDEASGSPG